MTDLSHLSDEELERVFAGEKQRRLEETTGVSLQHKPTYAEAIYLARLLIEPGENPEYERGMCELIGDLWAMAEVELAVRAEEVHRDMLAVDINRPWNDQPTE